MKVDEKIALITGAAAGLGRELAKGFARAGAHVLIADIDAGAAESVAALVRAEGRYALAHLACARPAILGRCVTSAAFGLSCRRRD